MVLLAAGAAGLLAATALAFLRDWRAALLSNFRAHLAMALVAMALLIFLAGSRSTLATLLIVLLLLTTAVNLGVILWATRQTQTGSGGDSRLRLVFANLLEINRAHHLLIDWLREERPDVLIVGEAGSPWKLALAALKDEFPFVAGSRLGDVAIYSRRPFAGEATDLFCVMGHAVAVQLDGFNLVGVHTASPESRLRSDALDELLEQVGAVVRQMSGPVLVIGDFNAVPWSHSIRSFIAGTGLGFGPGARSGTFPAILAGRPFPAWLALPIDLVLTGGGARLLSRRRGPRIGSDHWPVVIELTYANAPQVRAVSAP